VANVKSFLIDLIPWDGVILVSFHDLIDAKLALDGIGRVGERVATFWSRAQVEKVTQWLGATTA
jgi:hypothetical protein